MVHRRDARHRAWPALVAAVVVGLNVGAAAPAGAASGDLILASTSDSGVDGNGHSPTGLVFRTSLAGDGTAVAFDSSATNLDPGDSDEAPDVYVKDLVTGDIVLASTSDGGTKGNGRSWGVSLSADGTRVAFISESTNLDPADPDTRTDAYVKDLVTGELTLVSTSTSGVKANGLVAAVELSADGTRVALTSIATNLHPSDTDMGHDVFVKELATGVLLPASTSDTGTNGDGISGFHRLALSPDGSVVAFASTATNLDPLDTDAESDIYVKDLHTGDVALASTSDTGANSAGNNQIPSLSADGRRVAFHSSATDLHPGDTAEDIDVYVKDLDTGQLLLASSTATGVRGDAQDANPSLSADGLRVAFDSSSATLGASGDVVVKDLSSGMVLLASKTAGVHRSSADHASLSSDGIRVAFRAFARLHPDDGDDNGVDAYVRELPGRASPVAVDDAHTTPAGTELVVAAAGVLANDTDADPGDTVHATLVAGPSHGGLSLAADGGFSYTPSAGYVGNDTFTYRVSDGLNTSQPATVTIAVTNIAPVAQADAYSTGEDTSLTVPAPGLLGNDTDGNGDDISASLVAGPDHGTLSLAGDGSFTYRPDGDFSGADSFTYRVTDGSATSAPVTVSLEVQRANDAPTATAGADQTVDHEAAIALRGTAGDADGDGLTYAWTQVGGPPATIRDPDELETLVEGVDGPATLVFRLTVTDPSGASSSDDITVTVKPK